MIDYDLQVRNAAAAAAAASDLELDTLDLLDGVDSPLTSLSTAPDDDDDGPPTVPMPSIAAVACSSSVASANTTAAADSVLTRMPRLHLPPSAALSSATAVPKKPVSKNK